MGSQNLNYYLLTPILLATQIGNTACATRYEPASAYRDYSRDLRTSSNDQPPVILLLIDGLGSRLLQAGLSSQELPHIGQFFLHGKSDFDLGRATFPSLTYPNITSILTASNIQTHGIIGNRVFKNPDGREVTNFESLRSREVLNRSSEKLSIFSKLRGQRRSSISLAHYFYSGATIRQADDIKSAVAYASADYGYLDEKAIGSLQSLVESTSAQRPLPAFTFVHLIGVDAISHQYGPYSPEAHHYLASLDHELGVLFDRINLLESEGIKPIVLLTADHGFTSVLQYAQITSWIESALPGTTILNEGRFLGLRFDPQESQTRIKQMLASLALDRNVAWALSSKGNKVSIDNSRVHGEIKYVEGICDSLVSPVRVISWNGGPPICPADLDKKLIAPYPPYFFSNIATYFESSRHPDALILAADHVSYSSGYRGVHGGLTLEELLVPLLYRNANWPHREGPHRTFELLSFLSHTANAVSIAGFEYPKSSTTPNLSDENSEKRSSVSKDSDDHKSELGALPQSLTVSSPATRSFLSTSSRSESGAILLDSGFSPNLSLVYRQAWSPYFTTDVGYHFQYLSYTSPAAPGLIQQSHSAHGIDADASFRFGESLKLQVGLADAQNFFLLKPTEGSLHLSRAWIPELSFSSKSRVFSTFVGNFYVAEGVAILLPSEVDGGPHVYTGFSQGLTLSFENPVGDADSISFSLGIKHGTQDTTLDNHEYTDMQIGAGYTLALPR